MSGQQAVNFRNFLKGRFSGLGRPHPRNYSYQQMLNKYNGSEAAVINAASRTNSKINAAGGIAASGAAITSSGNGC
ncbi:hypothetical protein GCM10017044_28590 [Kordiimonas sediminis]|uniref:Uncharacterized protein n=1 Tax=Kordiimonas sediminis TaxID=1735581 RepID=A0A919EAV5_9PROT|nr:hypothetical protein [Kordiimonas sediminis]GHF31342.1 hypothetical protein GCM10017044_28590 [Kordiimonas sediminis]